MQFRASAKLVILGASQYYKLLSYAYQNVYQIVIFFFNDGGTRKGTEVSMALLDLALQIYELKIGLHQTSTCFKLAYVTYFYEQTGLAK